MDTITIAVFGLIIVALVALGRPIRGKIDEAGAEINTYIESSNTNSR